MDEMKNVELKCYSCEKVIGSITGPTSGVERELRHHEESRACCSDCQVKERD